MFWYNSHERASRFLLTVQLKQQLWSVNSKKLPRFVYTKHATVKMVERGLAPDVIEKTLLESNERYVDTKHNTLVAVDRRQNGNLVVAYRIEQDRAIIVTVFAPENINRLVERRISKRRWEKFG